MSFSVLSAAPRFSVVVPTLNEAENIDPLIESILRHGGAALLEIIFVDDGSSDGTPEMVKAWEGRAPVRLLSRAADDGLAGAVVAGARCARSEIVVVMDGDLSHPAEALPQLVAPVAAGAKDMVIGSRYTKGGATPGWPVFRRVFSRGAAAMAWPLTEVRDSLSGYFAVRRELIVRLGPAVAGFKIGLEILVRGGAEVRVGEVPITFRDRAKGKSKMTGRVISIYLQQIAGFFVGRAQRMSRLNATVLGLWSVVVLAICIRASAVPHQNTVLATYLAGGEHWRESGRIYTTTGGFVYSPVVAAFFAAISFLPTALANTVWRLGNVAVLAGGVWWWLRSGLHKIGREYYGIVFLLLLPLAIGNVNNGQVNPMVIGLLLASFVAARTERWWIVAICLAVVTYLKIYPLVVGMLLVVMFPRKLGWRLAVGLAVLGLSAFFAQRPEYVIQQYREWLETRLHDNRHLYQQRLAPRDFWLLLTVLHVPVSALGYKVMQVVSGGAIALYAALARRDGRVTKASLVGVMMLSCCWMLLFGPASESSTYLLLAPAVALALGSRRDPEDSIWLQGGPAASFAILAGALVLNSLTHLNRHPYVMIIQPIGACVFFLYAIGRISRRPSYLLSIREEGEMARLQAAPL